MFKLFSHQSHKEKIKRIIKNAPATKPSIIASKENKLINNSSDETTYNKKDAKDKIPNKIKFFKTRLIFLLLARTGLDLIETDFLLTFLLQNFSHSFFNTCFFTINYNKIQSF